MVRSLLARLGAGPLGPVRLALALAVPSLPVITLAIAKPSLLVGYQPRSIDLGEAFTIAVIAVAAAALAGGFAGGRLARRHMLSVIAALVVAWLTGMASLSIVPALLGIPYEGAGLCLDGCQPFVTAANPLSGAIAWALGLGMSTSMVAPPIIAVVLLVLARRLAQRGDRVGSAAWIVAAYGVAQWIAFAGGGIPAIGAYLCLGAGVIAWSTVISPVPAQPRAPVGPVHAQSAT